MPRYIFDVYEVWKRIMENDRYRKLIADFGRLVGLEHEIKTVCRTGSISCNEVAFTLLPAAGQAGAVTVYTNFGDVPAALETQVYRRLLEVNLFLPLAHGPRWCVDADNGQVVFAFQCQPLSAQQLLGILEQAAAQARTWRQTYFLDQTQSPMAAQASHGTAHPSWLGGRA